MILLYSVMLPVIGAVICLLIPNRVKFFKEASALVFSAAALVAGVIIFGQKPVFHFELGALTKVLGISLDLRADALNSFILVFISSTVTSFSSSTTRSRSEPHATGTRSAIPSILPLSSGITSPIAFAAPVDVGIIDNPAALALLKSLCGRSRIF